MREFLISRSQNNNKGEYGLDAVQEMPAGEEWAQLLIRNADDAWAWFQKAVKGEDIPEKLTLRFEGWPTFEMNIKGRDWDSTVPTRVMAPLLEIQKDIHRKYVEMAYGSANLKKLKEEDREQLEIVVKVERGSSDYKAPLDPQLNTLAEKAIKKMTSRDLLIAVLGIALIYGGVEVNKAWVVQRQTEVQAGTTVELSRQETERLRVFEAATKQQPILETARQDFEESQNRLLKTLKPGDKVSLPGVELSSGEAQEITQKERARSESVTITGAFRVLANDATKGNDFRIKVARISDGLTFQATVPFELDSDMKRMIQKAEWSKGALAVNLDISASMLRGSVTEAEVINVSEAGGD